jgi:hypothetical protein
MGPIGGKIPTATATEPLGPSSLINLSTNLKMAGKKKFFSAIFFGCFYIQSDKLHLFITLIFPLFYYG